MKRMGIKYIDATPDKNIYTAISARGYSLHDAIAELVDNSIDAKATQIKVDIRSDSIEVQDNGFGMGLEDLGNAMILGKSNKKDSLGIFGIGMKASCLSLGEEFIVESKQKNTVYKYVAEHNLAWLNSSNWGKFPIKKVNNQFREDSFTKISIIPKKEYHHALVNQLYGTLGRTYAMFLLVDGVKLILNNKAIDPFRYVAEVKDLTKKHFTTKYGKYHVEIGRLKNPKYSASGLSVMRNLRIIWWGRKYGYNYDGYMTKLFIMLYGTNIPVTSDKRDIEINSPIWEEVDRCLLPIINAEVKKLKKESKNVPEKINTDLLNNLIKRAKFILKELELYSESKGKEAKNKISIIDIEDSTKKTTKTKKSKSERRNLSLRIGGKSFNITLKEIKDKSAKVVDFIEQGNNIMIVVNEANEIYSATSDRDTYLAIFFYDGLAMFIADKLENNSSYFLYKNLLISGSWDD